MGIQGVLKLEMICPTSWDENKLPDFRVITRLGLPHSAESPPIITVWMLLLAADAYFLPQSFLDRKPGPSSALDNVNLLR